MFWRCLDQTSIGWRQVCLEHAPYEARAHVDGSRGIWDFPLRLQKETWTSWIGAGPVLNKTFTLLNKNMQIPCVVRGSGNFKALLGLSLFKRGEPQMVWPRAASCTRPIWKNCVKERREQYRSSRLLNCKSSVCILNKKSFSVRFTRVIQHHQVKRYKGKTIFRNLTSTSTPHYTAQYIRDDHNPWW